MHAECAENGSGVFSLLHMGDEELLFLQGMKTFCIKELKICFFLNTNNYLNLD
jgi:hypothetical protein